MQEFKRHRSSLHGPVRALLAALPLLAAASPSHAQGPFTKVATYTIRYRADSLSTPEGLTTLRHRIERAARQVCDGAGETRDPVVMSQYTSCVREATGNALAEVRARTGVREAAAPAR